MIKGVNRQIVEVNDTGSPYFEKIFFILSANAAEKNGAELHCEMRRLLDTYDMKTPVLAGRKKRGFLRRALSLLGAAAAGAAAILLIAPFI